MTLRDNSFTPKSTSLLPAPPLRRPERVFTERRNVPPWPDQLAVNSNAAPEELAYPLELSGKFGTTKIVLFVALMLLFIVVGTATTVFMSNLVQKSNSDAVNNSSQVAQTTASQTQAPIAPIAAARARTQTPVGETSLTGTITTSAFMTSPAPETVTPGVNVAPVMMLAAPPAASINASPSNADTATVATPTISAEEAQKLLTHAKKRMAEGQVNSARAMLERAARSGNGEALYALAETYNPDVLKTIKVVGVKADRAQAKDFYAQALARGYQPAQKRLEQLGNK